MSKMCSVTQLAVMALSLQPGLCKLELCFQMYFGNFF